MKALRLETQRLNLLNEVRRLVFIYRVANF